MLNRSASSFVAIPSLQAMMSRTISRLLNLSRTRHFRGWYGGTGTKAGRESVVRCAISYAVSAVFELNPVSPTVLLYIY